MRGGESARGRPAGAGEPRPAVQEGRERRSGGTAGGWARREEEALQGQLTGRRRGRQVKALEGETRFCLVSRRWFYVALVCVFMSALLLTRCFCSLSSV